MGVLVTRIDNDKDFLEEHKAKQLLFGTAEGDNERMNAYLLDKAVNLVIVHFHSLDL